MMLVDVASFGPRYYCTLRWYHFLDIAYITYPSLLSSVIVSSGELGSIMDRKPAAVRAFDGQAGDSVH